MCSACITISPPASKSAVEARVVRGAPSDLAGPAIVELPESTLVVPPGWRCTRAGGGLRMEREPSTR